MEAMIPALWSLVFLAQGPLHSPGDVRYGRDIRPILSNNCFQCHGPDPDARKEDLRLDLRQEATADRGGYSAIVPGNLEESELWYRINAAHAEERMPPVDSPKRGLNKDEIELLRRWIEAGALYEEHWAFTAPVRPQIPTVADSNWPHNEVDSFILDRLERAGLAPSPEADRATLVRRVFLDLTGLPPTPEESAAFLADARPDAFERLVDRLMTARIDGLPEEESEDLLEPMFETAERPEFVYEHGWTPGDLLLWDNLCSAHARTDFSTHERRLLRRCQIESEGVPAE